jgi:hypothetical protein
VEGFFSRPGASRSSKKNRFAPVNPGAPSGRPRSPLRDDAVDVRRVELDVVVHAAAQERVGELLLGVAGDDHDHRVGVGVAADGVGRHLGDAELAVLDLVEEVVGKSRGALSISSTSTTERPGAYSG